jgi:transposase
MEQWTPEHRAFVVETFFKTGDSVTLTQRRFRVRFNVGRHGKVPSRNTILLWIANFRSTGSALKKKPPGGARTVRTPENVEIVRRAVLASPHRSAAKHAIALGISDRTVRRILNEEMVNFRMA